MIVVYIAGKYTDTTQWKVKQNIQRAEALGAEIVERFGKVGQGVMVIIPHTNTAHWEGLQDDQWFYDATMELLRRSDVCVHVPGDQHRSKGTRLEIADCANTGKPVFEGNDAGLERFRQWLTNL